MSGGNGDARITPRCGDCIAFVVSNTPALPDLSKLEKRGTCHRQPPQMINVLVKGVAGPEMAVGAGFPEVGESWWCCAFAPKKKPTGEAQSS